MTLANPGKRNALDHEMLDALAELARHADHRCLLLTGEGKMFSAGYDIGTFDDADFEQEAESLVAHPFHAALEALEAYRYPVVAALNGHAIGGGLELALTATSASPPAASSSACPPPSSASSTRTRGCASSSRSAAWPTQTSSSSSGRNVDTERAYDMGLVNEVAEPEDLGERSLAVAAEIAANAPLSLAGNKRIIRELRRYPGGSMPEPLEKELVELRESCFRSEDFREGVRSFAEKRPPEWRGE